MHIKGKGSLGNPYSEKRLRIQGSGGGKQAMSLRRDHSDDV